MRIKLPNGLVDGADHFNFAMIDELRGKQQNYLVDRELVIGNIGHVPKILEDMILELQTESGLKWKGKMAEAVQKLPSGDLELILIKVRENTYGPRFYHEAICEHCEHTNKNLRLDLDQLAVTPLPIEELIKPKIFTLPKSQMEVELKPSYLSDLFSAIHISKTKTNELITSLMATSIKRIGDKSPITAKDLESVSVLDLEFIQDLLAKETLQGTVDTDIETTCTSCSKDFKYKLNAFDPSFFDRSKGSSTSNT